MKKLIILLMSIVALQLEAQTITNYSTADGLLSDFVECIDVDINDNVWLGTSIGLQMFDGSSLAVYDVANYPGMLSDNIKVITAMANGEIWIGTDYGANQLVSGVNGVGKTTTIGKIGKIFRENGNEVLFSACDTFRAAAIDQLEKWSEKVNATIIKSNPGSDPASVAYKALEYAKKNNINQVLIDTAGRLQNKKNLMDEFKKIANVIKKSDETAPHEVILVLDATSGQNIINQLEEFNKIIPITGLIMTKLDGTAKGGVLIAISKKYKVPIVGLGLGEKEDDLQMFSAEKFANAFIQLN